MIPVSEPDLGPLEREYLLDAFDSGWISSRGAYIAKAEGLLRKVSGAPFAAVCNNGTTALHLALLAAGVGPGDEVILPSLTYVATLNAVYYVGARPVFVDVDDETWCLDSQAVSEAVTSRTSAIIGVDIYGQPADYTALRSIADRHELKLIADAAESIGATLDGVKTGALADITTFSFFGNKVITSGEGGAVTTASEAVHEQVLQLRNQGNHATERYRHDVIGYNYRMTNLSAAILTAQLERAEELIMNRRRVVRTYSELLDESQDIRSQTTATNAVGSPWMHSVRLVDLDAKQRDDVIRALHDRGIETRPVFHPVQYMPFVPEQDRPSTPIAERIGREGISLPTFPAMQEKDIAFVASTLRQVLSSIKTSGSAEGH